MPPAPIAPPLGAARPRAWILGVLLLLVLVPQLVSASRPVITAGREAEILALFDPYGFGDELAPGWTLHSFAVDKATIEVWIVGPDEAASRVTIDHVDFGPRDAQKLEGFAIHVEAAPGGEAAVAELVATIDRNDDGEFWAIAQSVDEPPDHPFWLEGTRVNSWARDGLVLLGLFCVLLFGLVAHKLRGAEPWMKWTLLAIVVVAAVLRVSMSPTVALAPWPYTRFLISARLIYTGPGLALIHGGPLWMTDVIVTSTLALALLAPLAVYVHARYLLDDHRAALIVAGVLAVLPLHLRFSHSDAAFIPSITVSSVLFTLIHVATRDPSNRLGWLAVAIIGFPLALVFVVRPLNVLYVPLLIATAWVNHGVYSEKPKANRVRVGVAFAVVILVTALGGIPWLLEEFGHEVRDGLRLETLTSAAGVLLSPRMNALLNPAFTPPGLTVLAVCGAVDLWRRGKRPLFWFLVLWLFGFMAAHAYVIPESPYMQARYHLHLVVPFMLLVACGAEWLLRWLAAARDRKPWLAGRRYPAVVALVVAYVIASPLIHARFIRYTELNDVREWIYVHEARELIPEGCHVIEFEGDGENPRFARVGAYIVQGVPRSRWNVHPIPAPSEGQPLLPDDVRELLEDMPECLVWYEGLPCFGNNHDGGDKAGACAAIEGYGVLEELSHTQFSSAIYDENYGVGLEPEQSIQLTLYRVYPKPPG